jgi:hypothetical protein
MRKPALLLAMLASVFVVAAAGSTAASAKTATTSPGYNFKIVVLITNKGVILSRSVAKRGWLAHFVIQNKSKEPHRFEVGGLKSRLIGPGKSGKVGAYLENRGQYEYKLDDKLRGYFQVV